MVSGDTHAKYISVVRKDSGLASKGHSRVAAIRGYVNERHSATDTSRDWPEIEIDCPITVPAYIYCAGVQTIYPHCQIRLERLIKPCAVIVDTRKVSGD